MLITRRNMLGATGAAAATAGLMALAGCNNGSDTKTDNNAAESTHSGTLVVSDTGFESKFSPFFAASSADQHIVSLVCGSLVGAERMGNIIMNGIEGETIAYNGTDYTYKTASDIVEERNADGSVSYTIKINQNFKNSDGTQVTADDVIFSLYTLFDPTYNGSATTYSLDIKGLQAYRSGMSTMATLIFEAGRDNTDTTYFTADQQAAFWAAIDDGGTKFAQEIVDYCTEKANATSVAEAAAAWGFDDLAADATATDFFEAIMKKYGYDFSACEAETAGSALSDLIPEDVYNMSTEGVATGASVDYVEGVERVDDFTVKVTTEAFNASTIYQMQLNVGALAYYGDPEQYDYEAHKFGFPKGDLSLQRAKTTKPFGAGPYVFDSYSDGTVYMKANENYFLGKPKIENLSYIESQDADKVTGVQSGTLDVSDPSYSLEVARQIGEINGVDASELEGKVMTTFLHDFRGYGYMGINADRVSVAGDPSSDASKALRKGIATIIAAYREQGIKSYYGSTASVIQYPISTSSWASPTPADAGYQTCYSKNPDGSEIYTDGMDDEAKFAAAKEAALKWFEVAGYTVADGKVTAAPAGAKGVGETGYEIKIGAGGSGDHPTFMVLKNAADAFAEIGFKVVVDDIANASDLYSSYQSGQADMWCAAWQSTNDPDMYQLYHSQGSTNYYKINDAELDELIVAGRTTDEQSARRSIYMEAMDIILDWGVELPVYQRSEAVVISTERVKLDTVAKDQTPYWQWMDEIEKLELN